MIGDLCYYSAGMAGMCMDYVGNLKILQGLKERDGHGACAGLGITQNQGAEV